MTMSLGHHSEHHPGQTQRGVITKEEDKRLISTLSVVVNPEEVFGFTSTVLEKSKVGKGWDGGVCFYGNQIDSGFMIV
ncbi:hypothetical protein RUM44_002987 [Polyplax serrata]|uniref:Uncharacterized protein n=1 Tax=Polyplax serrata TaxID=468196 RepID=A0ABR1AXW7_POLSC